MASIWKEHLDMLMSGNESNAAKQNFERLLRKCNGSLADMREVEITDSNRAELIGLMGLSIQLQTSIEILSKLEAIETGLKDIEGRV